MQKHQPFGWIKPKKEDAEVSKFMIIDTLRNEGITTRTVRFNYYELIEFYTFADGTSLGIMEEE